MDPHGLIKFLVITLRWIARFALVLSLNAGVRIAEDLIILKRTKAIF